MLEKGGYNTWQSHMLLYVEGKEHRDTLLDYILHSPFQYKVVDFPANEALGIAVVTSMQTFTDLIPEGKIRNEYSSSNLVQGDKLMEGTECTKKEKESKLADEFDRFTSEKGETIHSYYIRFAKMMNDINIIGLEMKPLQLNTKNEPDANEVRAMNARFPYPLALIENTYNPPLSYSSYKSQYNLPMSVVVQQPYITQPSYEPPAVYQKPLAVSQQPPDRPTSPDSGFVVPTFLPTDDPIASLNKAMIQAQGYGNAGRGRGTGNTRVVRTVRDLNAIPPKVIRCYNYKGEGNYAKQCTSKKRVKDSEWFKEKMLLAQQQEAWIEISDEQQDS
ncbi:hypothetical protein Tco_1043628 [Tanacetum coccineum]|uniref:Uncharacterized protein n=1 Tax=Tanacetum coccineum TaxID=301880 RepID=A0ABQ5GML0_9ASTR